MNNEVRPVDLESINILSLIHLSAFKGFFLSELGNDFLFTYYDAIRKNNRGVLLGYFEDNELLGFCAATTFSRGFNSYLVKSELFSFAKIGILLLFTKPKALIRLLKNFTKSNPSVNDNGMYAELLSIAVSPSVQGKGIGKKLLLSLEEYLREKKISELSLTTDYHDNEKTLSFYYGMGYEIMYDFITYPNRRMYRLIRKLQ
jgi:ribosomal protein S18 acetylase RimI-like enzyme